eukprot:1303289-Prymnesium_polylepis.1
MDISPRPCSRVDFVLHRRHRRKTYACPADTRRRETGRCCPAGALIHTSRHPTQSRAQTPSPCSLPNPISPRQRRKVASRQHARLERVRQRPMLGVECSRSLVVRQPRVRVAAAVRGCFHLGEHPVDAEALCGEEHLRRRRAQRPLWRAVRCADLAASGVGTPPSARTCARRPPRAAHRREERLVVARQQAARRAVAHVAQQHAERRRVSIDKDWRPEQRPARPRAAAAAAAAAIGQQCSK